MPNGCAHPAGNFPPAVSHDPHHRPRAGARATWRSSSIRRCSRSASAARAAAPPRSSKALVTSSLAAAGAGGRRRRPRRLARPQERTSRPSLPSPSPWRRRLRFFSASALLDETPRLANPSDSVFRAVGCYGVAEGAALAAVGKDGALVVEKRRSAHATCAIARAPRAARCRARSARRAAASRIIGIGPGDADWRTAGGRRGAAGATDIVGLRLYLDLLGPALAGKNGHEAGARRGERAGATALDLAATGRSVALVSSGDAGIYGLATLVFELIDREERAAGAASHSPWSRPLGAAGRRSARRRAAGPRFLRDLPLRPADAVADIERGSRAAADGDFVVALYNPRSQRRRLAARRRARDPALRAPPATPRRRSPAISAGRARRVDGRRPRRARSRRASTC